MTDFNITILQDYLAGKATEEQEREILAWLEASEENRRFFADMASNFTLHETLVSGSYEDDCEDMLSRPNSRIDAEENASRRRQSRWRSFPFGKAFAGFSAVAVAAVLFVLIIRPGAATVAEPEPVQMITCANSTTGVRSLLLADQTKIFLKPGSEIEYNVTGINDARLIKLKGEAFFDVARDTLRPMTVQTDGISVKVLGTAFTVKSRPGDSSVEVVLERGSVRILSPEGVGLVRLSPDQKATYNMETGDVDVLPYNAVAYVVDQFNLSSLDNVTTESIVRYLEHLYGVKINATIKDPQKRYYFKFLKTDSIEDVLKIVEQLTGENCRLDNTTTNNQSTNR